MPYFRFEKLNVWTDAKELVSLVYKITSGFPAKEHYGLTDQIRRAAVSIALNIAEGASRKSSVDFKRFLIMAQGSVYEVVAGFYIALDQHFVSNSNFELAYEQSNKINAKINALMNSLNVQRSALNVQR